MSCTAIYKLDSVQLMSSLFLLIILRVGRVGSPQGYPEVRYGALSKIGFIEFPAPVPLAAIIGVEINRFVSQGSQVLAILSRAVSRGVIQPLVLVATAVVDYHLVFVAVFQSPGHASQGNGPGIVAPYAIGGIRQGKPEGIRITIPQLCGFHF